TLTADPEHRVPYLGFQQEQLRSELEIVPIEEVETAYYLRMSALDKPGVLSQVAQILSDSGISIEALIQKEAADEEEIVPLILLTNRAVEKQLVEAIIKIESLSSITGPITRIRVEPLK
ncbi:ACT domain-containing protein, partial [Marinimicrobium sp. UBA4509]